MKVDIFNTKNKYQIIYADPPYGDGCSQNVQVEREAV